MSDGQLAFEQSSFRQAFLKSRLHYHLPPEVPGNADALRRRCRQYWRKHQVTASF